jgi:hypothetical protein
MNDDDEPAVQAHSDRVVTLTSNPPAMAASGTDDGDTS